MVLVPSSVKHFSVISGNSLDLWPVNGKTATQDSFQCTAQILCVSTQFMPLFCSSISDTRQFWLKVLKRESETPTQRPEWRPASKTYTETFLKMWCKRRTVTALFLSLLKSSSLYSLLVLHLFSFCVFLFSLCFPLHTCFLCMFFFHSYLILLFFKGLLGSEEPLPRRSRCSLQLIGVVVPEDAAVLSKELGQCGLSSSEWPLLIFLSRESKVINA